MENVDTPSSSDRALNACPVVLRKAQDGLQFLAFKHPAAGMQIVKGGIEQNESPIETASRELKEESGLTVTGRPRDLGKSDGIEPGERWHFFLCPTESAPDEWSHQSTGDDGHQYQFFWQSFDAFFTDQWHPKFIRAIRHIQRKLESIPEAQLTQYLNKSDASVREIILSKLGEIGPEKSLDPTAIARAIAGSDEKQWRQQMKPIRNEVVRLAKEGRVQILRKGKPASPDGLKGLYKMRILPENQT